MDMKTVFLAMFIAAAFTSWPNLAKPLGIKPGIVPFVVIVVALGVIVAVAAGDIMELKTISTKALVMVLIFAIANGIAIYFYAGKAADKNIQTGIFVAVVSILQVCFAVFINWIAMGQRPNLQQFLGLCLAIPAVALLTLTQR